MSKRFFTIDNSDKSILKSKDLKEYVFWTWLTGRPSFVNHYTLENEKGIEIMSFKGKRQLRKFANILLREANKSRSQAVKESGKSYGVSPLKKKENKVEK